jgi:hypothetical protein
MKSFHFYPGKEKWLILVEKCPKRSLDLFSIFSALGYFSRKKKDNRKKENKYKNIV